MQLFVPSLGTTFNSRTLSFDYFGTFRGRLGIVPHQSVLLYATGGLAWAKTTDEFVSTQSSATFLSSAFGSTPGTLLGFVVGAGAEASLGSIGLSNVLLRLEYLHHDYGKRPSSDTTSGFVGSTTSFSTSTGPITVDVVRAGISMKFWPGS
jgi:outer membrane immunogenic protein